MLNLKNTGPAGRIGILLFMALSFVVLTITKVSAQTLTTLYSFNGGDGAYPTAGVIADASGNLYGTTNAGGANNLGTVFKLAPSGTEIVLHSFSAAGGDGQVPYAGVIADAAGSLYGTTFLGGAYGYGTVFKLTQSKIENVLYSFTVSPGVGAGGSMGGLIADASGNLYGTTSIGGVHNVGTVFKLTPSGAESVLYSFFPSLSDGYLPEAGVIADASGNLYGTTLAGGANGAGSVFELTPSGAETILHFFSGSDGAQLWSGLIADAGGNLYGTTASGGAYNEGTVFKLTTSGVLTDIYSFSGSDGANPWTGSLIADALGNLYGTTLYGGSHNLGTIFKLTMSGSLTVLHSFSGNDGAYPWAGLIADGSGNFYGTTAGGGATGYGTVFALSTTPQGEIQLIVNRVNSLYTQGVLNQGQDNSLVMQLSNATKFIIAGKINGAIGNLQSFISEVNDLSNSGTLSASQAASLITAATIEIAQIHGT